ncbi:2240_t:CDS:2, partial [Entrophospora sp. SA101]
SSSSSNSSSPSSSSGGYSPGGFADFPGGGGGGGSFSPPSTSAPESSGPPTTPSQPRPTATKPQPKPAAPRETPLTPEVIAENVVIDNGKGNQPEKDQKPTKNKITTTEQVKLVQETITKVAQAQKSQVYSPELHHWLIEQKENNPQIYQMVNAHQQQIEKAIQHLEQLRVQKQAGQIRSRTKEGKQ